MKMSRRTKLAGLAVFLTAMTIFTAGVPNAASASVEIAEGSVAATGQVAIVIDDFGNNMGGTDTMMELKIPITVAVMPFMSTSKKDAEWAHKAGHEVIVHLPMEPLRGKKSWLGPGAITTDLTDDQIRQKVNEAIDNVPYAIGMNNHMGSKATSDARVVRIVLEVCKERGLFFLDSRTNYRSVIKKIGQELGVPVVENELFLDDIASQIHVKKQLRKIVTHLNDDKRCIAIGHVGITGKHTSTALHDSIPELSKQFQFVKLTTFLPQP